MEKVKHFEIVWKNKTAAQMTESDWDDLHTAEERTFKVKRIEPIPMSPEIIALRPFILPQKGFSLEEVMTLIQKTYNAKS